jgi:RNA-directed DNA polymerase
VLSHKHAASWLLEGDIRACFDGISHDWLLSHIPMDRVMLKKWLKAGFIDKQVLYATEAGVPQGGIVTLPTKLRKAC